MQDPSSLIRDQKPIPPAVDMQSANHWPISKVLKHNIYMHWETKKNVRLTLLRYSLYCIVLETNLQGTPV